MPTLQLDYELGAAQEASGLTVFPLFAQEATGGDYITAKAALDAGLVDVSEVDGGGEVPSLAVTNHAAAAVLFVEGETIVGLKQNGS